MKFARFSLQCAVILGLIYLKHRGFAWPDLIVAFCIGLFSYAMGLTDR